MARYIDADELRCRVKEKTNPYGKPTLDYESGVKVLNMIDNAPTADVVPKSEVEKLSHKCDECAGCTQWKCDCANIELEVAREIFEEIESKIKLTLDNNCTARVENINKDCRDCPHARLIAGMVGIVDTVNGLDNIIVELKKKYTESEDKV